MRSDRNIWKTRASGLGDPRICTELFRLSIKNVGLIQPQENDLKRNVVTSRSYASAVAALSECAVLYSAIRIGIPVIQEKDQVSSRCNHLEMDKLTGYRSGL
jgi:hypothetical protein